MEENGRGERAAGEMRERASEVAAGVEDHLEDLRGYVDDAGAVVRDYAREHPWAAIGIAAGIGFILGRLMSRR
ncbi:MAG TPA: hypothetical protein VFG59_12300 [Anaeromyxobacter sp.]|nr:hypothetical protein [Anaeromyxobacter sp.]